MATSHDNFLSVDIFRNTSTLAAANFAKTSINAGTNTLHISCGDIDGDGLPDLAASAFGAGIIYIWHNQSTPGNISFAAPIQLLTTGGQPQEIVIRDLNLDGKPEIIASNRTTVNLSVFRNISTPGTITIAPEISFGLPITALNSSGLAVEDLNNDGKPEVVVNPFLNSNVYIFQNDSPNGGGISFRPVVLFNVSGNLSNLVIW